ncbi:MAG: glycolate oxidase subunit GlcF [Gammaproteobacteria bacterium]
MQGQPDDCARKMSPGDELRSLLRSCVHCGFCNAVCPTYQLLGNELDGPRGRIYLIRQALEGQPVSRLSLHHLDRCLTCRSCESACPSGVRYGELLDSGRVLIERKVRRRFFDRIARYLMLRTFPYRCRFDALMSLVRWIKPVLPRELKRKIPARMAAPPWVESEHSRVMLILPGCVQSSLAPSIDVAAARVLDKLGISLLRVRNAGCCGALPYHLSDHRRALKMARRNIDACRDCLERGAEAIVMTASACGLMAKEYGRLLQDDVHYAEPAARFSAMVKDIGEVLARENLGDIACRPGKTAFHSPCTLQHGQKLNGVAESILRQAGCEFADTAEAHLCCGSAGVYALLQSDISEHLLANKLAALTFDDPDRIATANIGCLLHLQSASSKKIVHWIELLR